MKIGSRLHLLQQVQRALRNWNLYKKLEKEAKLAYLGERVKLQRELIGKSDTLVGRLQEEAAEKRREVGRMHVQPPHCN